MKKTILITGATDGIGLATAKTLLTAGHHVLLHGRNPQKLESVVRSLAGGAPLETYVADLSDLSDVEALAKAVTKNHAQLDVLINNAGVLKTAHPVTKSGLDVRFVVNTVAPYLLTQRLLPLLAASSRVINLSSAAQSPVTPEALIQNTHLSDRDAYAQSKLALTMWSRDMALTLGDAGPVIIAVNPGSLLGSKMVKESFGITGGDIRIGANIVHRAALDDAFASASGLYFDNDQGRFASPHPDALNPAKTRRIVDAIETIITKN